MSLHYGTSSWSEKSWIGVFYPEGIAPAEMLTHYAGRFGTVEADVTYYRIPSRGMVQNWYARTPDDFILSAKFPRSIVHGGEDRLPDPARLLDTEVIGEERDFFLEAMAHLGKKCGPLILQFPYFNKKVFTSPEPFYQRLDAFLETLPGNFRYGVELRNSRWITGTLIDLLKAHNAALVWADIPYMPFPDTMARTVNPVTADFLYIRLIGDRKAVEEKTRSFNRIVLDKTDSLARWVKIIREYRSEVEDIFLYANNHYAGHGPATVRRAVEMLQDHPE